MKTIPIFKKSLIAIAVLATGFYVASCDKDDDIDNINSFSLSGNASGSQVVPPVTTNGTATLSGSYNPDNNMLNYTINWSNLSGPATMMHFHGPAATGVSAGAIVGLNITANGVSGTASGNLILSDTTENHLLTGKIYYNIHTALYPDGEIRGQVTATAN